MVPVANGIAIRPSKINLQFGFLGIFLAPDLRGSVAHGTQTRVDVFVGFSSATGLVNFSSVIKLLHVEVIEPRIV